MKKQVVYYVDEKGGNPVWEFISDLPMRYSSTRFAKKRMRFLSAK